MNVIIDLSHASTRDSFHDAFVQALSLPDWYGRNLDALHDALTSISEETCLILQNWNAVEATLGNYAKAAQRAIRHAAQRNPNLTVEFV